MLNLLNSLRAPHDLQWDFFCPARLFCASSHPNTPSQIFGSLFHNQNNPFCAKSNHRPEIWHLLVALLGRTSQVLTERLYHIIASQSNKT